MADRVDYRRTDNPGSIAPGLCLAISRSLLAIKIRFPGFTGTLLLGRNFCIEYQSRV